MDHVRVYAVLPFKLRGSDAVETRKPSGKDFDLRFTIERVSPRSARVCCQLGLLDRYPTAEVQERHGDHVSGDSLGSRLQTLSKCKTCPAHISMKS